MVNVAPLYRPTLRVKISTRGRALLCQIVQKKVVIRVNPAARVKMCLKFRPHRDPCVEVRKVSEVSDSLHVNFSAGSGAPTDPVLDGRRR